MTTCPACAKPVSEEANACPGCGHPLRKKTVNRTLYLIGAIWTSLGALGYGVLSPNLLRSLESIGSQEIVALVVFPLLLAGVAVFCWTAYFRLRS